MVKTLEFGDKSVSFSTSFAWMFRYKSQFGVDAAQSLVPIIKKASETTAAEDQAYILFEELGFTGIASIAWAMASLLDSSIPDPERWVTSFGDDFPFLDIVSDLIPEAIASCFTTKKSKAPEVTNPGQ